MHTGKARLTFKVIYGNVPVEYASGFRKCDLDREQDLPQAWGPTSSGKILTLTKVWSFTLYGDDFVLRVGSENAQGSVLTLERLQATPGVVWATITFQMHAGHEIVLDGIPNLAAKNLLKSIAEAREKMKRQMRVTLLTQNFDKTMRDILQWARNVRVACLNQPKTKGCLTF